MAGSNHTLPTLGTARFSSPLSVDDFIKKTQVTYYTPEALEKVANGQATKLIVPSDIQNMAGLAASLKELVK